MAIEVEVYGNEQVPKHKSNVIDYTYSDNATPVIPGDSSGGVGSLSFSTLDDENTSILFYGDTARLSDSHNGGIAGVVKSVDGSDGIVSYSGVSDLIRLNVSRYVPYINGTIGEIVTYVLTLAGISTGFNIDNDIDVMPAVSAEYDGDLWVFLKDLCTTYEFEIALVDDVITVRKLRERTLTPLDISSESWTVADINPAQYVEVNYYNYDETFNTLVYPAGGWNKDVQVYQVDAGQTLSFDLELNTYLTYVEQPTVQYTVGRYDTADSVYCVAANDGLPVPVAEWNDYGGSLTVEIDDKQTNILHVTLIGANIPDRAPFRIAVSAGTSDYYSSLHITGSGLNFEKKSILQPTGLQPEDTANVIGVTIDNKFISTISQARDVGKRAAIRYGMPTMAYSFNGVTIGDFLTAPGTIVYTHFFEYDEQIGNIDFDAADASYGTWTFEEFDDNLPSSVVDGVEYQLFGNVTGARLRYRDSWYRVISSSIQPASIDVSSDWDTLFDDFNVSNSDRLFSDFNTTFNELKFSDFNLIPLRVS